FGNERNPAGGRGYIFERRVNQRASIPSITSVTNVKINNVFHNSRPMRLSRTDASTDSSPKIVTSFNPASASVSAGPPSVPTFDSTGSTLTATSRRDDGGSV